MIIFNKKIKQEIKKIKIILRETKNANEALYLLREFYERISNRPETDYSKIYFLDEIFESKTIGIIPIAYSTMSGAVLEFVKYKKAPNDLAIIYNEFESAMQTQLEIFITRGD